MWRAVGCPKLIGSNPVPAKLKRFPNLGSSEDGRSFGALITRLMMCPVRKERRGSSNGMLLSRPPESEMAGVLAGSEF